MKTAVITGASYGIGEAIVRSFLEKGWKVYGLSRTRPVFTNTGFTWLSCDLSQSQQIKAPLLAISEPVIDALISNAGVISVEMASDVTESLYNQTFSVNVLAPMLLVHELREKIARATILSVSSLSDRMPGADIALYCSSKAANTLYFNCLAMELKEARVYTILPDYVSTPMLHSTMDEDKDFNWNITMQPADLARLTMKLLDEHPIETGANIIAVNEALKNDLRDVEPLYGYNTDTDRLVKL